MRVYPYTLSSKDTNILQSGHEKGTIFVSEPKHRKAHKKRVRFIFRSENPQKVRLLDTVGLFSFCWFAMSDTLCKHPRTSKHAHTPQKLAQNLNFMPSTTPDMIFRGYKLSS